MMGTGRFHNGDLGLRRLRSEAGVWRGLMARAAPMLVPVLSVCISGGAFAAEQWLKVQSSHFELLTLAGERKGREAVLHFETVRSFFLKTASSTGNSQAPVCIVAFNSEKEYRPYSVNEAAKAYYYSGRDRDYIVMSSISSEQYPVAIHEYTHLLLQHSGLKLPLWLNDGLADLYSTLKPSGGKVQVGALKAGHDQLLQEKKEWLDLETLVAVDHDSPLYNERNRASLFYAQSW